MKKRNTWTWVLWFVAIAAASGCGKSKKGGSGDDDPSTGGSNGVDETGGASNTGGSSTGGSATGGGPGVGGSSPSGGSPDMGGAIGFGGAGAIDDMIESCQSVCDKIVQCEDSTHDQEVCHDDCVNGVHFLLDELPECVEALGVVYDCMNDDFDCDSDALCEDEYDEFASCYLGGFSR